MFLSEEEGRSPTDIARKVGCTRHTVYSVLEKESSTGTVHDRPKSGRKRKLTTEEEQKVVKKARKVGATQTAREFSSKGSKKVSEKTVRKTLKKYKFFYLKKKKIPKFKLKIKQDGWSTQER